MELDRASDDGGEHRVHRLGLGVEVQRVGGEDGEVSGETRGDPAEFAVRPGGVGGCGGHRPVGLARRDRLAGLHGCGVRFLDGAAQLAVGQADARVAGPDRPVRSQRDDGAVVEQVAGAPAPGGPLGPDPSGPVVGAVRTGLPGRVDRLQTGHHVEAGEPGQQVVRDGFEVLDPVRRARGPAGLLEDVEGEAHGAVADGVGGGGDAAFGEEADGGAVGVGVAPERLAVLAVDVGVLEPGGAVVGRAVEHELHPVDVPAAAAQALEPGDPLPHVGGGVGGHQRGAAHPQRQLALLLQVPEHLLGGLPEVEGVQSGEAAAGEAFELRADVGGGGVERDFGVVGEDQVHGLEFEHVAGRAAVPVDHDGGGVGERLAAGEAGEFDGAGADHERVGVAGQQGYGASGEVLGEEGPVRFAVEHVDVEVEAGDPLLGGTTGGGVGEAGEDLGEGGGAGQVDAAAGGDRTPDGVGVGVDEAGQDRGIRELVDRGGGAAERGEELGGADGGDPAGGDGDALRGPVVGAVVGAGAGGGVSLGVGVGVGVGQELDSAGQEDGVGVHGGFSRVRAERDYGCAGLRGRPGDGACGPVRSAGSSPARGWLPNRRRPRRSSPPGRRGRRRPWPPRPVRSRRWCAPTARR